MPFRYDHVDQDSLTNSSRKGLPELRESNESLKRFRIEIDSLQENERKKEEKDRRSEYVWENLTMIHICVVFGKRNTR